MKNKIFKRVISLVLSVGCVFSVACIAMVNASAATTDTVTKRALMISAPSSEGERFPNNVKIMKKAFASFGINTTTYVNEGAKTSLIKDKLQSVFGSSKSTDVNYLFTSSHGLDYGILLNGKSAIVTFNELRQMLDKFNGRFVIIISACYSGGAITDSVSNVDHAQKMINSFLYGNPNATSDVVTDSAFEKNSKYTVFCSSLKPESSYAISSFSYATYAWAKALGYDALSDSYIDTITDINNDNIITPAEFQTASVEMLLDFLGISSEDILGQHLCYYSPYDYESVFFYDYPLGDVNLDGKITSADVLLSRQYIVGAATLTNYQKKLGDLNFDNKITSSDILLLRKLIVGSPIN